MQVREPPPNGEKAVFWSSDNALLSKKRLSSNLPSCEFLCFELSTRYSLLRILEYRCLPMQSIGLGAHNGALGKKEVING